MQLAYPQSIPCAFDGFPAAMMMTAGAKISEIVPSASFGSRFKLTRTPKCGVAQGDYVVGSALPECRMIYSDTGSDDDFTIKVSFLGYGTFYKVTNSDLFLRFMVYKAIAIETPTAGKEVFGDTFDCETFIPAGTDTTALFEYDGPVVQYVDQATSGGTTGTVVINGQKYRMADGSSITITSATGGTLTYTWINRTLVVS